MIVFLVRHGAAAHLTGRWLAGRLPDVPLVDEGHAEALALADAFDRVPVQVIYSSPLQRAIDTICPLADRRGIPVTIRPRLTDVDFGTWTGRTFDTLTDDPAWAEYNTRREHARAPSGESLRDVRARAVAEFAEICAMPPGPAIVVTHAEVIRCLVGWATGATLDAVRGMDIAPASTTVIDGHQGVARVLHVNVGAAALPHVLAQSPGLRPA